MGLYENIKNAASKKGYSINKLEKELGFARSYILKFKTITPSADKIQKIADFLDVSTEYLMTGKEPSMSRFSAQADLLIKIRNDKRLMNAIEKYYDLSEKKKTHVLELIELLNEEA